MILDFYNNVGISGRLGPQRLKPRSVWALERYDWKSYPSRSWESRNPAVLLCCILRQFPDEEILQGLRRIQQSIQPRDHIVVVFFFLKVGLEHTL
jgi:hypothetical protein